MRTACDSAIRCLLTHTFITNSKSGDTEQDFVD